MAQAKEMRGFAKVLITLGGGKTLEGSETGISKCQAVR